MEVQLPMLHYCVLLQHQCPQQMCQLGTELIVTLHCHIFCHFAAAPGPPRGVLVRNGANCYTSVVSWTAPQSRCAVMIGNYSVRYRLKNGGGNYITVHSPTTSVTLEHLVPYTEYIVSVAAINSAGDSGSFTGSVVFDLQGNLCLVLCFTVNSKCHMHPCA